jgi:hypothetical protein
MICLIPTAPSLPFPLTPTFTALCLSQCHAPFFTVRHEEALLPHITQHTLTLYLLPEAFEQLLL